MERLRRFADDAGGQLSVGSLRGLPFLRPATRRFVQLLDGLALDRGVSIWVEKTPDHVFFVEDIQKLIPGSLFIHITRDGREVVASLYEVSRQYPEVWGRPWGISKCIEHWAAAVTNSLRYFASGRNHVLVRYEDLLDKPLIELERLASFLDIAVEPDMLTRPRARNPGIVRASETWKAGIYDSLVRQPFVKFERVFDEVQQAYVAMRVARLNFELARLEISSVRRRPGAVEPRVRNYATSR
jgi:hypothetical protein